MKASRVLVVRRPVALLAWLGFAGRVLLWGCVLLLLVRGALSLLSTGSRVVTTTRGVTVTVTQPVSAEPSNARRK